ncbi:hypothetical protein BH23ACT3_BH23ACT3_07530 [soil metagenome]
MLSRPTTEQIILDCRNELLNTIDPAVSAEPVKIAIQMMENVLRNAAARAAHEIAWMHEEGDAMLAYARRVAGSSAATDALTAAIDAYEAGSDSLHLDDVCATYDLAGCCHSEAIEAAMASDDLDLQRAGREVLELRLAHENEIMGEWAFVGRA